MAGFAIIAVPVILAAFVSRAGSLGPTGFAILEDFANRMGLVILAAFASRAGLAIRVVCAVPCVSTQ